MVGGIIIWMVDVSIKKKKLFIWEKRLIINSLLKHNWWTSQLMKAYSFRFFFFLIRKKAYSLLKCKFWLKVYLTPMQKIGIF